MNAVVLPSKNITGTVRVPASKSQTIRGIIFGLLANGTSRLLNPLLSEDTQTAVRVCQKLGAEIDFVENRITTKSRFPLKTKIREINTGNSGITTRFILPVLGLRKETATPVILDCGEQMRRRPIRPLVNALNKLGMNITYLKHRWQCPLMVSGQLAGGEVSIEGTTSQYLSALLIALPLAPRDSKIIVRNLNERAYVKMTLNWLRALQVKYIHHQSGKFDIFRIAGGQKYRAFQKVIPGDFSSASYLLAAGCLLGGKVVLKGLDFTDAQGDKEIVGILRRMGGNLKKLRDGIEVRGGKKLKGIKVNANDIPDLLPTLAVVGTQAAGKTVIGNVPQARIKETDRIKSMVQGLRRLGAKVVELQDGLVIYHSALKGATVNGFDDHRTVMALTLAGMLAEGGTVITGAEAVDKTFPGFFEVIKKLGGQNQLVMNHSVSLRRNNGCKSYGDL